MNDNMEYPIHSKEQLNKICENITDEWAKYLISELNSYGLDFSFEKPVMDICTVDSYLVKHESENAIHWDYFYIRIYLFGHKLPDDVKQNDNVVLTKFLKQCANDFVNSRGKDFIKDYSVTIRDSKYNICRLDVPAERAKIEFSMELALSYSGN